MEETDKRTKAYKETRKVVEALKDAYDQVTSPTADEIPANSVNALILSGIPLAKAVFHRTVTSRAHGEMPETAFFASGTNNKSRLAKIWYTPHGVVVEQNGKHKIIPLANVSDTNVL